MRKHGTKFRIGLDYSNDELLEKAKKILIGTKNTRRQVESLMKYIGNEQTEVLLYAKGTTFYAYKLFPEPNSLGLMELCDIGRIKS